MQAASATSDSRGLASTIWTMGTTVGVASTATASAAGLSGPPLSFSATVLAAPASTVTLIQGDAQSGVVGQALPVPVVAEFHDAFGNLASNQPVVWAVTGGGKRICHIRPHRYPRPSHSHLDPGL